MPKQLAANLVEVTVVVYVDGKEWGQHTEKVPAWAADYVAAAALTQVQDPDYEAALDVANQED